MRDYAWVVASSGAFAITSDGRQIYAYYVDTMDPGPTGAGGSGAIITECDLPENVIADDTQEFIDDWHVMAEECRRQTEDQRRRLEEAQEALLRQMAEQSYEANEERNRQQQEAQRLLREQQRILEEQARQQEVSREELLDLLEKAKQKPVTPPVIKQPVALPKKLTPSHLSSINPLPVEAIEILNKVAINKATRFGLSWAISEALGEHKKKKPKKK
jgi:hypothetical protein